MSLYHYIELLFLFLKNESFNFQKQNQKFNETEPQFQPLLS